MIYKPARGSKLTEEQAQRYGERIETIIEDRDGNVTPESILEDAGNEVSPLHDFFEWDNAEAAQMYRLDQARYLLRSIHIVVKREDDGQKEINLRAFHNVNDDDTRVYVSVQRVFSEEELRQQVLEQALKALISWQSKYSQYKEFAPVVSAIEEVRKEVKL